MNECWNAMSTHFGRFISWENSFSHFVHNLWKSKMRELRFIICKYHLFFLALSHQIHTLPSDSLDFGWHTLRSMAAVCANWSSETYNVSIEVEKYWVEIYSLYGYPDWYYLYWKLYSKHCNTHTKHCLDWNQENHTTRQ